MLIANASPLAVAAVNFALTKVGVHETTENWGPEVKAFLAAAKIYEPAPWCCAFANWAAESAAKQLGVKSPLELVPLQGYVQSYVTYGKANGWVVPASQARGGDLFCLYMASLKRYAHIGFVTRVWFTEGFYTTIEGNTNHAGSREGDEVAHNQSDRPRIISPSVVFLRWAK